MSAVNVKYADPGTVSSAAVIGTGSVGGSWAALFMARGMRVYGFDSDAAAATRLRQRIQSAWPALRQLSIATSEDVPWKNLQMTDSLESAVDQAAVIQENVPEVLEVKSRVILAIDAVAGPDKIILSSTGGIPPSLLQQACKRPERFVVLHPFHPAHLIPLVEVVGGKLTSPAVIEWAMSFARSLGKHPILLTREAMGHLANRLQFALLREVVHCIVTGVASPADIDAAVRLGLAPRWNLLGGLLTLHLAGGSGGMAGILDHAGPAINAWWDDLGAPVLTADVKQQVIAAAIDVAKGHSVEEWERWRDQGLADLLAFMKAHEPLPHRNAEQ